MIRLSFLLALLVGTSRAVCATALPPAILPDSIGVEYRGNKMLIKHLVTAGETLYGLSRRYKVTVESIVEANPQLQGALVKGQVVLVPRTRVVLTPAPRATSAAPAAATPAARALPTDARGNRVYTVKPGQTLFSIAQRYGVSTTELIRLNRLPASGVVNASQTLIIVPAAAGVAAAKPAPTRPAPAPVVTVPPAAPAATPRPEAPDRNRPTPAPASPETAAATDDSEDDRAPEHANEIVSRVRESGLAAIIEGSTTEKYLALHKTAPVGTIMQVRNIMNGQSVYVRVIGHLPDTGDNANMLVRLSPRAVQRLVTPDQRFRVETSYVP